MEDRIKIKLPNCWICKDQGLVIYKKKISGINYQFAARCRCIEGSKSSSSIGLLGKEIAEEIAEDNFNRFRRDFPGLLEGIG